MTPEREAALMAVAKAARELLTDARKTRINVMEAAKTDGRWHGGAGTTGLVADRLGRNATLIELNPAYRTLAAARITDDAPLFAGVA